MFESDFFKNLEPELRADLALEVEKKKINLQFVDKRLTLNLDEQSQAIDFDDPKFLLEVRQNYSRSESVYSFLKKIAKNQKLKILDLTAGMGRDMFKFVLSGHKVKALERNPVLYVLLKNARDRFFSSNSLDTIKKDFNLKVEFSCELHYGDSIEFLKNTQENFDLIYYDPMFEDRRKKAAPKKHMQMIKKIVDTTTDSKDDVLSLALEKSKICVLKSSQFSNSKLKPSQTLAFKGYNYFVFKS